MRKTTIGLLVTGAVVAIGCSSGGTDTLGPGAQGAVDAVDAAGKKKSIVLEVTGPKEADITYGIGSDQSQQNGAKTPWKKSLTSTETVLIATLVAQSKGTKGKIGCKITIDGKVVKQNTSEGAYAMVTCSADNLGN